MQGRLFKWPYLVQDVQFNYLIKCKHALSMIPYVYSITFLIIIILLLRTECNSCRSGFKTNDMNRKNMMKNGNSNACVAFITIKFTVDSLTSEQVFFSRCVINVRIFMKYSVPSRCTRGEEKYESLLITINTVEVCCKLGRKKLLSWGEMKIDCRGFKYNGLNRYAFQLKFVAPKWLNARLH